MMSCPFTSRRRYNMLRTFMLRPALVAMLAFAIPGHLYAQQAHSHSDTAAAASHAAHGSTDMGGMDMSASDDWKMAAMAKHMAYSSPRPLTAADSARAAHVINDLRQAIAKYQDVTVADADGYKMFAPQIKNQPQYHFTKKWNAIRNQFGFDPARPTLFYIKRIRRDSFI